MNQRSDAREPVPPSGVPRDRGAAWARRLLTVALLGALVSPAIRDQDSLPLSTYPMYSSARTNESSFVTAIGIDDEGNRVTLSALTIAESRDRLIAQSFLNDAVRRGEAASVCADIAERVDVSVVALEIATERHDTIARLQGEPSVLERNLHASCKVTP